MRLFTPTCLKNYVCSTLVGAILSAYRQLSIILNIIILKCHRIAGIFLSLDLYYIFYIFPSPYNVHSIMETKRKSPMAINKVKKKMTKEQIQLAIIKKKECDAKALIIVEHLLEPEVDPIWLMENLKDINRCHMEDVIEERAIVKLCGYVLCHKPITVIYNQRYHISLKDKKVYDITKRKNFCSSSCFGASNYLLEQMLTSPLWLRDKEDIPNFKLFHKEKHGSNISNVDVHGEEINIAAVKNTNEEGINSQYTTMNENVNLEKEHSANEIDKEISGCIENFVLKAVQDFELKDMHSIVDKTSDNQKDVNVKSATTMEDTKEVDETIIQTNKTSQVQDEGKSHDSATFKTGQIINNLCEQDGKKNTIMENRIRVETMISDNVNVTEKDKSMIDDDDIIEQRVYPVENKISYINSKNPNDLQNNYIENENIIEQCSYSVENKNNKSHSTADFHSTDKNSILSQEIKSNKSCNDIMSKAIKKKKQIACKKPVEVNLAARVEQSFHEWITDETIDYLFGDESIKQRVINAIKIQENHRILCGKLDRLQIQEEQEDAEILGKTPLKPAPHFAVLKDEGKKLDLKVRAFYEGKSVYEEPPKSNNDAEASDNIDTYLPLTDIHAPQTLRRKIFLEKLDQVLPDLLRTLAGNNDVYTRASLNYSSTRCTAVKALVHTFSLSAKNIIFKTAEWTLVGLVVIKMLSLSDSYLASLLVTKQANLYVSMILTAYKLNSDYLNLLLTSFNPHMNPR